VLAERGDHLGQAVAADVWARVHEDLGRGPVAHQDLEDVADVPALVGARIELAVAVRPGAALAEAVVRVFVDRLAAGEEGEIAPPRLHLLSAYEDDRGDAVPGELEGREEPGRPRADDDRALLAADVLRIGLAQRLDRRGVAQRDAHLEEDLASACVDRATD